MADFDLTGICSCCSSSSASSFGCGSLPGTLYGSISGDYCGKCQENAPNPFTLSTYSDPCTRTGSYSSGEADRCPDQRGYGVTITLNSNGTVSVSNPGGYCGPPNMTVTPDSYSPFSLTVTYEANAGNSCCTGSATMTLTITE